MDLLDVLRVAHQHVLVDELPPELAPLRPARAALPGLAAHRQRTLVFLADPTSSLRRPEISLHGRWTGSTRVWPNCYLLILLILLV